MYVFLINFVTVVDHQIELILEIIMKVVKVLLIDVEVLIVKEIVICLLFMVMIVILEIFIQH